MQIPGEISGFQCRCAVWKAFKLLGIAFEFILLFTRMLLAEHIFASSAILLICFPYLPSCCSPLGLFQFDHVWSILCFLFPWSFVTWDWWVWRKQLCILWTPLAALCFSTLLPAVLLWSDFSTSWRMGSGDATVHAHSCSPTKCGAGTDQSGTHLFFHAFAALPCCRWVQQLAPATRRHHSSSVFHREVAWWTSWSHMNQGMFT